jgi:hypothetical protein
MFNINDYDLENLDGRGFYEYIKEQYYHAAREAGVDYANVYLNADDSNDAYFEGLECDNRLFLELILHAQNSSANRLSNIVNWNLRKQYIQETTRNFNPREFLNHYTIPSNNDDIYIKNSSILNNGKLKKIKDDMHIESESPTAYRFIKYIVYYAVFIVRTYINHNIDDNSCKVHFYNHLFELHDVTKIENYLYDAMTFGHKVPYGYSTALLCDLLKESDNRFNYLVKPDTHIKHVFKVLFGLNTLTKTNRKGKSYEVIVDNDGHIIKDSDIVDAFASIITRIYNQGITDINAYKLDKMLFILCNDKGFYAIDYNGTHYSNNHSFSINKETLLNYINAHFKINHR